MEVMEDDEYEDYEDDEEHLSVFLQGTGGQADYLEAIPTSNIGLQKLTSNY